MKHTGSSLLPDCSLDHHSGQLLSSKISRVEIVRQVRFGEVLVARHRLPAQWSTRCISSTRGCSRLSSTIRPIVSNTSFFGVSSLDRLNESVTDARVGIFDGSTSESSPLQEARRRPLVLQLSNGQGSGEICGDFQDHR